MSLPTHKEGDFSLFHLFGIVSDTFLAIPCYRLFHFLQVTTSQNVLSYKFTLNQLLQGSASVIIKRDCLFELQSEAKWYYKVAQVQQIRAIFIIKWGNLFYKVGQQLYSSIVQKASERNRGNRFWQPTSSFNPNFPVTLYLQVNYWEAEFRYNQKQGEITTPPQRYYLKVFLVLKTIFFKLLQNL